MTGADRKAAFLVVAYSAKFAADTLYVEPPRPLEPTDDNLRKILAECVRPPREHHLPLIRQQFLRDYGKALERITAITKPGLFEVTL